jgi:hypothetical protein
MFLLLLGLGLSHIVNGRFYAFKYVYRLPGFLEPSYPIGCSEDAVMVQSMTGSWPTMIIFDNRLFLNPQWLMSQ